MKIVHLVTQDNGGAGRACIRLHKALLKEGVDSIILTQNKTTDLPSVKRVAQSKFQKAFSKIRPFLSQLPLILYPKRNKDIFSPNLPFFTPSNRILLKQIEDLKPDVVHLHWIEGGFFNIKDLESIQAPILWSLHDANPYTGGCHYVATTCIGVSNHCKSCPLLKSKFPFDISFWTFKRKNKTYNKLNNLTINGLSSWIASCAKDSALLGNKPIVNLPNPIDTSIYRPIHKNLAREILHIHTPKRIISFGAIGATSTPRKGFYELKSALESLSNALKAQCELIIFGSSQGESINGISTFFLGTLHDDIALTLLYSASDVFIMPSLVESFGQTALESLSCGTPVVAFDTSGLKDIITHKHNGYLAKCYEIEDLKNGIEWILSLNTKDYAALAHNAHKSAVALFGSDKIAHSYIDMYQHLAGGGVDKLRVTTLAKSLIHTFFPHLSTPHTYYIGFGAIGGADTTRKGFYELKSALESLPNALKAQCELIIFGGNAPEISGIKKTHILGFVYDDSSLALAFNACDVFIAPSLAENLSNVIMESLSCGTPVVAFDIGGNSDMITHKHNGYLATDTHDLSAGIEWALGLDSLSAQSVSFAATQSIATQFDTPKIAKIYIEAYRQLSGGGGSR
ncbi:glycosyltransferase [Helicobacter japonicus]|uniref:glycosyltransferase n=4 Tax=Helicobacter japonicus TaxID=425400 RepID=UPI002595743C|nr:glycosyltransferase [Helicobacter japonicus]